MESFKRQFNFLRFTFVIVFIGIIGMFVFRILMISKARNDGKTIYEIQVNSFNHVENYATTDYVKDDNTGCIKFKDEFGIKRIVCNDYTITEY